MSYFGDNVYEDVGGARGKALQGVEVHIFTQDGHRAALTDSTGAPVANPVITDASGAYSFYAADGLYRADFRYKGRFLSRDNQIPVGVGLPLPNDVLASLAGTSGAALVGSNDGAGGALWTSLAGFLNWLKSGAGSTGVGFRESAIAGAPAITTSVALESGPIYADRVGIEPSNSAATNTLQLKRAVETALATGRNIVFRQRGNYINENIDLPTGENAHVSIYGMGYQSGVIFTGAAVDKGFNFDGGVSDYAKCGNIVDLYIACQAGAKRGVTFRNVSHGGMYRSRVDGAAGTAVDFHATLMMSFWRSLLVGCGSATEYALTVGGEDGPLHSTTFNWYHSRISGGLGPGGNSKIGGMSINRISGATLFGGNIESNGQPLVAGNLVSSVMPVIGLKIGGGFGFENPGNDNTFFNAGLSAAGAETWGGTGYGMLNLTLGDIVGTPTGTTAMPAAAKFADTIATLIEGDCDLGAVGNPVQYDFVGGGNLRAVVRANGNRGGAAPIWVRENGTQRYDASPQHDWFSNQVNTFGGNGVFTGSIIDIAVHATQGGIYRNVALNNASPTDVTNIRALTVMPAKGTRVTVYGDGNSTLKHASAGAGPIYLKAGADLLVPASGANSIITLESNGTQWVQV